MNCVLEGTCLEQNPKDVPLVRHDVQKPLEQSHVVDNVEGMNASSQTE